MPEIQKNDFELFCRNQLLQGIPVEELKYLYEITQESTLHEGSYLMQEGKIGDKIFFILSGTLEVTRQDPEEGVFVLNTLAPGEVVGEIAFIDQGARSASVIARTPVTVRALSFADLEKLVQKSVHYSSIYAHMSKNICERLRSTSNKTLLSFQTEAQAIKTRGKMGTFLIYMITLLSLFSYALTWLKRLILELPNTTYVSVPFTLIVGGSFLHFIKYSKIGWKEFGINTSGWKNAMLKGISYSFPIIILSIPFKFMFILWSNTYKNQPLFDPFAVILDASDKTWTNWLILNAIYCFLVVPFQELLARGILQGLLETFLEGNKKVFMSILISNLIFGTVHIQYSITVALITFGIGLYLGWIYSRTHNLIVPIVAHAILGIWGLSILGILVGE